VQDQPAGRTLKEALTVLQWAEADMAVEAPGVDILISLVLPHGMHHLVEAAEVDLVGKMHIQ
jgi:hypothetical protein